MIKKLGFKSKNKLQLQMIAVVAALVFLFVLGLTLISGMIMERDVRLEAQQYTLQILDQVMQNIDYYISGMERIAAVTNRQPTVLRMLFNDAMIDYNKSFYYHYSQAVQQLLRDMNIMRNEMLSIVIAGENGSVSSLNDNFSTRDEADFTKEQWYIDAKQAGGRAVFSSPHLQAYSAKANPVISLNRAITVYEGGEPLGVISIELNLDALSKICSGIKLRDSGYIYIVNEDGSYIYHPDFRYVARTWDTRLEGLDYPDDALAGDVLADRPPFISPSENGRYIVSKTIPSTNWRVVGVMPYSELTAASRRLRTSQILMGLAAALLASCVTALLLSRMAFRPIGKLRMLMYEVERGNFGVEAAVGADNEIGDLSAGFNIMIRRIAQLVSSVVEKEKEKRHAEMAALQAQINPHFLYNTLDTIAWMAQFKQPEAPVMANALANLFRLTLSKGEDMIPLGQEFEHVESYLQILKMRYKSRFNYAIQGEEEALGHSVPKLIVQPLVENSVYHGIKVKRAKCFLLVRAIVDGADLVIYVSDDGVGMDEELSARILSEDNVSQKSMGGVGVRNIAERLHLYYGERYGLSYYSIKGTGTLAEIRIPRSQGPNI